MTSEKNATHKPSDKTEAEIQSKDGNAGQSKQSSHDDKSHVKAGTNSGAGGGKKQERKH